MELSKLEVKNIFFLILLIILGILTLRVFSPFLNIIVISLILVQLFYPICRWLIKKTGSETVSALISTLITLTFVVVPIITVVIFSALEVNRLIDQFNQQNSDRTFFSIVSQLETDINARLEDLSITLTEQGVNLEEVFDTGQISEQSQTSPQVTQEVTTTQDQFNIEITIDREDEAINDTNQPAERTSEPLKIDLTSAIGDLLSSARSQLVPFATSFIQGGLSVVFYGIIMIMTLVYLFKDYQKLPNFVSKFSPLDDRLDETLFKRLNQTTRAVIIGNFAVAFAQATAVIILMLILGVGAPVLLWLIMVLFSLIPVGSGVVWIPVGVGLIATGNPIGGIILIAYGAIVINLIETTLRPYLLKDSIQLHPLVIMFSALGGIFTLGPLGLLYGPLIVVLFTSLMSAYSNMYERNKSFDG